MQTSRARQKAQSASRAGWAQEEGWTWEEGDADEGGSHPSGYWAALVLLRAWHCKTLGYAASGCAAPARLEAPWPASFIGLDQ
ncbi:hypothetical protein GCM10027195_38660 [Comamonas sediminis]